MLDLEGRDLRVGAAKGRDTQGRGHKKMIESVLKTKEKREMMECGDDRTRDEDVCGRKQEHQREAGNLPGWQGNLLTGDVCNSLAKWNSHAELQPLLRKQEQESGGGGLSLGIPWSQQWACSSLLGSPWPGTLGSFEPHCNSHRSQMQTTFSIYGGWHFHSLWVLLLLFCFWAYLCIFTHLKQCFGLLATGKLQICPVVDSGQRGPRQPFPQVSDCFG